MDTGLLRLTPLPVRHAKPAAFDVLRLCGSERDAALVSVRMSGLTQTVIAERVGVSKQAMSKFLADGFPASRVQAFCNVTGTALLAQYQSLHRAMRDSNGTPREADRIAQIAAMAGAA